MRDAIPIKGRFHFALFLALITILITAMLLNADEDQVSSKGSPTWSRSLPSSSCPGTSDTNCHRASPLLVDLTGDGLLEIIVGTNRGHVLAFRHNGSLLWDKDIAGAFGMNNNRQRIASSPAAADIDADGKLEIVLGTGSVHSSICTEGGAIVLEHNGAVKKGWPFSTKDFSNGCQATVYSTPALGDLDNDGDMEIVFGGFDKRIYALDKNGSLLPGFPVDSYHYQRFGWGVLKQSLADTIWSSPALADLNGDGYLDIVIGSDEGNFDNRFDPPMGNWSCPYRSPITQGYCGGSIYALDRHGKLLPGFPRYKLEIIQSTAAIIDIDGDGRSEMFIGTGDYYFKNSPDKPTSGFRLYGLDSDGSDLPGWSGGKRLGGVTTTSPALGDIDGDGMPEVVIAAQDKKVYAFELNGKPMTGFPMTPRTYTGKVHDFYGVGTTPILADYTGDGKMEIFLRHAWEITIVDGKGRQLTMGSHHDSRPGYVTNGTLQNSPAVGDLDGDGRLELVTQNSDLMVWRLPNSSAAADWPMLKRDPARTSIVYPEISFTPEAIHLLHEQGKRRLYTRYLTVSSYLEPFGWTADTENSSAIRLPVKSGTVDGETTIEVRIIVDGSLPVGQRNLGDVKLIALLNGEVHSQTEIPVKVQILKDLHQTYLPFSP